MSSRGTLAAVLLFAAIASGQTPSKTRQVAHTGTTSSKAIVDAALKALVGHEVYICTRGPYESDRPFYDGVDANGDPMHDVVVNNMFRTNDRLRINYAEIDTGRTPDPTFTTLVLTVLNERNKIEAGVEVGVRKSQLTTGRLFSAVTTDSVLSRRPIEDGVRIGMTRSEAECIAGPPDHINSDELGGDQLIYRRGDDSDTMYIYISPRTDRVTNIQTSY